MDDKTSPSVSIEERMPARNRQGRGARNRQETKFRSKKNVQFAATIRESVYARLGISDPTKLSTVKPSADVVSSRVPVVLRALPSLFDFVWKRMKAIGTEPFLALATDRNRAIFIKVLLTIFEAKISYAQRATQIDRFDLPSVNVYTVEQLVLITSLSRRLPFPIVIALEALGNFVQDQQLVVPVLATHEHPLASGAYNFAPSHLKVLFESLRQPQLVSTLLFELEPSLRDLPVVEWVLSGDNSRVQAAESSLSFWAGADPLPPDERQIFRSIIASMETKPGFLILTDITHGDGSPVPIIRFPDSFDPDELETNYYTTTHATPYDEALAGVVLYGLEPGVKLFSRFSGDYDEPFMHGNLCIQTCRQALVWADHE